MLGRILNWFRGARKVTISHSPHAQMKQPRIYELDSLPGGWSRLSDLAEMADCTEVQVLERFGQLCRDTHHLNFAYQLTSGAFSTFLAHWMSIVATNDWAHLGNDPTTAPSRLRVSVGGLFVPAGWAEDVAKAIQANAAYVTLERRNDGILAREFYSHNGSRISIPVL